MGVDLCDPFRANRYRGTLEGLRVSHRLTLRQDLFDATRHWKRLRLRRLQNAAFRLQSWKWFRMGLG